MTTATLRIPLTKDSELSARAFLDQVLEVARSRKIDQASLARRANISPESLSRIKKQGSCRLVTALALARAAGLSTFELAERSSAALGAASIAARKLGAGRRLTITGEELVDELSAGPVPRHRAHLVGFFEELPLESVHDVILDEGLDCGQLALLARNIGAEGETVEWLEEMAGHSLA